MDYICAVWEQGRNAQYLTNTGESSLVDQLKRYRAKELTENNDARDKKSLFNIIFCSL